VNTAQQLEVHADTLTGSQLHPLGHSSHVYALLRSVDQPHSQSDIPSSTPTEQITRRPLVLEINQAYRDVMGF